MIRESERIRNLRALQKQLMEVEEKHINGLLTLRRSNLEGWWWNIMAVSNTTIINKTIVGRDYEAQGKCRVNYWMSRWNTSRIQQNLWKPHFFFPCRRNLPFCDICLCYQYSIPYSTMDQAHTASKYHTHTFNPWVKKSLNTWGPGDVWFKEKFG